jgi:hypothetical protein
VSCDIIGHGFQNPLEIQKDRVQALNSIVRASLDPGEGQVIWASGGDGGHVGFPVQGCARAVVELLARLHAWAVEADVPLRLTGHVGPVVSTTGADGRIQLVGDGINLCGSLLNFGAARSIVVSEPFRLFLEQEQVPGLRFRDERTVYLKHFSSERLSLMDIDERVISRWGEPATSEHRLLVEALARQLPWDVVYYAKRLLQSNSKDPAAQQALLKIAPVLKREPLLRPLDPRTILELVSTADLIERESGEFFCHYDDEGDTMFLVLTGEVGVVLHAEVDSVSEIRARPHDKRNGPGALVGELAFVLQGRRTASLQAVGSTTVLGFNYKRLKEVFRAVEAPEKMREDIQTLLEEKTLEHVCNRASYLIGVDKVGPLAPALEPWLHMAGGHARIMHLEGTPRGAEITADSPGFVDEALYILAGGELERFAAGSRMTATLNGRHLPVLFVDFPGTLVRTHHTYRMRSNHAVIVRIAHQVFRNLGELPIGIQFEEIVGALKGALARQFSYDVFLAYNSGDQDTAMAWRKRLVDAKLSVYMNEQEGGQRFKPEIATAILDSAVLVPLISRRVVGPSRGAPSEGSWVQREIRLRREMFDPQHANVLPILLHGARVPEVAEGITPILAEVGREERAIERAIEAIQTIKKSPDPIPFARERKRIPDDFR